MNLNQFENQQRKLLVRKPFPPDRKEIKYFFLITIITYPFLYAGLFMIPLIGQFLFLFALCITLLYLYVRKSLKLIAICVASNLIFLIPTIITIQSISVKNRLDVILFFLMATCIPISIMYILVTSGLVWYNIDRDRT